jgi:hypothetical protein
VRVTLTLLARRLASDAQGIYRMVTDRGGEELEFENGASFDRWHAMRCSVGHICINVKE